MAYSILKQLSAERRRSGARKAAKGLEQWYRSNFVSAWQKERVQGIREMYEEKQRGLNAAHDIASAQLSEEFMAYELEFLQTSDRLKGEHEGMEPFHHDIRALWSKAFYRWLFKKGMPGVLIDHTHG